MITSAINKHDGLIREFTHHPTFVHVKRIGGITPSEFNVSLENFNKFFTGNGWEIISEENKVVKVKERRSGFEGELLVKHSQASLL